MKFKFIFLLILIFFISISFVSASEDVNKTFTDLNIDINNNTNEEIDLSHDYVYDASSDENLSNGIHITRNLTINGHGHKIDGKNSSQILTIESEALFSQRPKVIIRDLVFMNANSPDLNGAAVKGASQIINCTFINSTLTNKDGKGGAVYGGTIINSTFISNTAKSGGAIYAATVYNCTFINNTANSSGGAINHVTSFNCTFITNQANFGGAAYDSTIRKSKFIANWANEGGAVFESKVYDSVFENNNATSGGAMYKTLAYNSNFTNNSALYYAGACMETFIANCIFKENRADCGGAISYCSDLNSTFIDNQAVSYGNSCYMSNISINSVFDNSISEEAYGCDFFNFSKSFTDLSNLINTSEELILEDDFTFFSAIDDEFKNGIVITHLITIDGQNHTINGDKLSRIFKLRSEDIVIKNLNIINGNTNGGSGGVIEGNATFINCTFSGNGFYTLYNSTAINCNFIGTNAMFGGLAINCSFIGNLVNYDHAVYNSTCINSTFSNYRAGATYYTNCNSCTFINNTANYGAAMYGGNAVNCVFINNHANYGGAIYVDISGMSQIVFFGSSNYYSNIIINSTFINNTATKQGGAVYGKTSIILNSTFINNSALSGGAIDSSNAFNCTFINNSATNQGGACFDSIVVNSHFENNTAREGGAVYGGKIINSTFINNTATLKGNAISNAFISDDLNLPAEDLSNVSSFTRNYASKSFFELNNLITAGDEDTIYLDDDYTFNLESDYAFLKGINVTRQITIDGQGHTVDGDNIARIFIAFNQNVIFKNLILINAYSPLIIGAVSGGKCINCTFKNNQVKSYGAAAYGSECMNCTFLNNSALMGSAIYNGIGTNCTFIANNAQIGVVYGGWVLNSTFINNTAGYGAGVGDAYAAINCLFINNNALNSGGALSGCSADACTFINNSAAQNGGAVSDGDVNNCIFISNNANIGGAVAGRDKIVSNSVFINNTALSGGAVYLSVIHDCNFTNNSAVENGGAVLNSTVFNSYFEGNFANNGGAIVALRVVNSTFINNKASSHGGAVYNGFVSDDCVFTNNSPEDTYNTTQYINTESKTFSDLYTLINSNNDSSVYLEDNYTFNIFTDLHLRTGIIVNRSVTIYGNGHSVDGINLARLFRSTGYDVIFQDMTFKNGHASIFDENFINGGAIEGASTVINCTFINNYALSYGGALSSSKVYNSTFINNTASMGGAIYYGEAYNSQFIQNHAQIGGATYSVDVKNSTFIDNSADSYYHTYGGSAINCTFKITSNLNVSDFTTYYDSNEAFKVNLTTFWKANITNVNILVNVYQNNELIANYSFISGNGWINNLDAGIYNVEFSVGNKNYVANSQNATLTVLKSTPILTASVLNINYFEISQLNITSSVDGVVLISLNEDNIKNITVAGGVLSNIELSNLSSGDYNITLTLNPSNQNYYNVSYRCNFTVFKKDTFIMLNVSNSTYGNDVCINVYSSENGFVILKVGNITQEINILKNNWTSVNLGCMSAGNYSVDVTFNGSDNLMQSTNKSSFTIKPATPTLNVTFQDNVYGVNSTIRVLSSVNGTLNISIYGDYILEDVEAGVVKTIDLGLLDVSPYDYTVSLNAGENYKKVSKFISFRVNPKEIDVEIKAKEYYVYGENITINITANSDCELIVFLKDSGKSFSVSAGEVFNGDLETRDVGDYEIYVDGGMNYQINYTPITIHVVKLQGLIIDIDLLEFDYGSTIMGITTNADCNVTINLNGTSKRILCFANKRNGIDLGIFDVGSYEIEFILEENENYRGSTNKTSIIINPLTPFISIEVSDINYGENAYVNVTTSGTGQIKVTIGDINKTVNVTAGKKVSIDFGVLDSGILEVLVEFIANNNFNYSSKSDSFEIKSGDSLYCIVTSEEYIYGSDVIINVKASKSGNLTLTTTNGTKKFLMAGGEYVPINLGILDAGNHLITIDFDGGSNYNPYHNTSAITVLKANVTVNVDVLDVSYGSNVVVNITADGDGNVSVKIGNLTENITVQKDVTSNVDFGILDCGNYTVNVTFTSKNYDDTFSNASFNVLTLNPVVEIQSDSYLSDENVTVNVVANVGGNLTVSYNNNSKIFTLEANKTSEIDLGLMDVGSYEIIFDFKSTANYNIYHDTLNLTVNSGDINLNVSVFDSIYGENIIVNITSSLFGNVTVKINDLNQTREVVSDEIVSFDFGVLDSDKYTVNITFTSKNNKTVINTASFSVLPTNPIITIESEDYLYGSDVIVNVTSNVDGNITVIVDGIVNKSEIFKDHTLYYNFTSLKCGEYNLSCEFTPTSLNYNNLQKEHMIKISNKLKDSDVIIQILNHGRLLNITLPENSTGSITFIINNNTAQYYLMNASASINLSNLNAGNYNFTVIYSGDDKYYSYTKTSNITVSDLIKTELTSLSFTMNYGDNKFIIASLKDINNNPIKNAIISVNLNGVKTLKSDEKGQIKISASKLVPNHYSVSFTFQGNSDYQKSYASVKVTVKKASLKLTAAKKTFKLKVKTKKYTVILKDNKNKALSKIKLILKVNKRSYKTVTTKQGKATFKITKLNKKGTFKSTITFAGNKYYNKLTKTVKITVKK